MATTTVKAPVQSVTQGVSRYPIGLQLDRPTLRWYAEIITPDCDVAPDGRLVDATTPIILGDIECTPGYGPDPGTRDLAHRLARGVAAPLGFRVGTVWYEGEFDGQEF